MPLLRARRKTAALVAVPGVQQDSSGNMPIGGGTPSQTQFSVDGTSTVNVRQNGALGNMNPSSELIGENESYSVQQQRRIFAVGLHRRAAAARLLGQSESRESLGQRLLQHECVQPHAGTRDASGTAESEHSKDGARSQLPKGLRRRSLCVRSCGYASKQRLPVCRITQTSRRPPWTLPRPQRSARSQACRAPKIRGTEAGGPAWASKHTIIQSVLRNMETKGSMDQHTNFCFVPLTA